MNNTRQPNFQALINKNNNYNYQNHRAIIMKTLIINIKIIIKCSNRIQCVFLNTTNACRILDTIRPLLEKE